MQSAMWRIREMTDKVTNMVMNYTEVEAKVREATNDDTWGPHGTLMAEIARETFTYEHFPEVMGMLWKRALQENKKNWRRVYKSLLLLSYLILNGSERVVTSAREHIYDLRSLETYTFMDELNRDQGLNVRNKVKDVIDFIQDDERLRAERKKARKAKDKYTAISGESLGQKYSDRYDSEPRSSRRANDFEDEFEDSNGLGSRKNSSRLSGRSRGSHKEYESDESPSEYVDDEHEKDGDENGHYEYKDEEEKEETYTSTTRTEKRTRTKRRTAAGKKLDLGAAAAYASDAKLDTKSTNSQDAIVPSSGSQPSFDSLIDADFGLSQPGTQQATNQQDFFADFSSASANDSFGDFNPRAETTAAASPDIPNFANFDNNTSTQGAQDASFGEFQSGTFSATMAQQSTTVTNIQAQVSAQPLQSSQPPQATPMPAAAAQPQPMSNAAMLLQPQPLQLTQLHLPLHQAYTTPMQSMGNMMGMQQQPMAQPGMMGMGMMASQPLAPRSTSGSSTGTSTPSSQKSTIWADSKVNISLDSLSPADKYKKPVQPSMNQLQGSPQQPYMGGVTSGMGQMNLGSPMGGSPGMMGVQQQQQPAANMMGMQGNMGMPQSPMGMQQGTMGMQSPPGMMGMAGMPNMGMQGGMGMQPNMGMGNMGVGGMGMGQQQQQQPMGMGGMGNMRVNYGNN
ncbi:clathrin interactor 1-like isoform X3 [Amphiura filiformis]|uniref:clathrin interactor 1-like isoform X3 n=1 Tax=Amphiura filiformis TaxID=82378 RepID=UPI003B21DDBF